MQKLKEQEVLKTPRIIDAFEKIDRASFVIDFLKDVAYLDKPLGIGLGQTISQPFVTAFAIELLQPEIGDKILDIGFGSGWQTVILAELVGENGKVFGIEVLADIYNFGKNNISKFNFIENGIIELFLGDGSMGISDKSPFDKIISGATPEKEVPRAWKDQLKIGGKLVFPMGSNIFCLIKKSENEFEETKYPGFNFLPLIKGK